MTFEEFMEQEEGKSYNLPSLERGQDLEPLDDKDMRSLVEDDRAGVDYHFHYKLVGEFYSVALAYMRAALEDAGLDYDDLTRTDRNNYQEHVAQNNTLPDPPQYFDFNVKVPVAAVLDDSIGHDKRTAREVLDALTDHCDVEPLDLVQVLDLENASVTGVVFMVTARDLYDKHIQDNSLPEFFVPEFILETTAGSYKVSHSTMKSQSWGGAVEFLEEGKRYVDAVDAAELA